MNLRTTAFAVAVAVALTLPGRARAQDSGSGDQSSRVAAQDGKFSWLESIEGTPSTIGQTMKIDSAGMYKLNSMFSAGVGIPFYYVRSTDTSATTFKGKTSTTAASTNQGLGNAYVQLQLHAPLPELGITSTLTGYAPTGKKGFSTGRATFDWDNRLEHSMLVPPITPFIDLGFGNSLMDASHFTRPFVTLGKVAHLESGAEFKLTDLFTLGASGYGVLPIGTQKMYSKLFGSGATAGSGSHHRAFETSAETTGGASLTRDYGASAYVDSGLSGWLNLELGFTHSIYYDINSADITVSLNMSRLLHTAK
jgi:hypothetical protein